MSLKTYFRILRDEKPWSFHKTELSAVDEFLLIRDEYPESLFELEKIEVLRNSLEGNGWEGRKADETAAFIGSV